MIETNTKVFVWCAIVWEVVVAILYGIFFRYSQATTFASMAGQGFYYKWSLDPQT